MHWPVNNIEEISLFITLSNNNISSCNFFLLHRVDNITNLLLLNKNTKNLYQVLKFNRLLSDKKLVCEQAVQFHVSPPSLLSILKAKKGLLQVALYHPGSQYWPTGWHLGHAIERSILSFQRWHTLSIQFIAWLKYHTPHLKAPSAFWNKTGRFCRVGVQPRSFIWIQIKLLGATRCTTGVLAPVI